MAEELVPREELRATLAAREELGRDFEPELVERFADVLERRLEERLARVTPAPARHQPTLAIVSLVLAVPLLAIAAGTAGVAGLVVVSAALVLVNAVAGR